MIRPIHSSTNINYINVHAIFNYQVVDVDQCVNGRTASSAASHVKSGIISECTHISDLVTSEKEKTMNFSQRTGIQIKAKCERSPVVHSDQSRLCTSTKAMCP